MLVAAAQGLSDVDLFGRLSFGAHLSLGIVYFFLVAATFAAGGYQLYQVDTEGVWVGAGLAIVLVMPRSWATFMQPLMALLAIGFCVNRYGLTTIVVQSIAAYLTARLIFGEAKRSAPDAAHSSSFHLWLAAGALLGAAFETVVAPRWFPANMHVSLVIALGCAIRPAWLRNGAFDSIVMMIASKSDNWRDPARRQSLARLFDGVVGVAAAIAVALAALVRSVVAARIRAADRRPRRFPRSRIHRIRGHLRRRVRAQFRRCRSADPLRVGRDGHRRLRFRSRSTDRPTTPASGATVHSPN